MRRNVSAPALWPAVRGRPRFVAQPAVAVHDDRNVAGRDQGLVHRTVDTLWHDKFSHFKMDCWGDLSHWTGNAAMMMAGPFSPPLSSSQSPLNAVSACGKTAPLLSPLCKYSGAGVRRCLCIYGRPMKIGGAKPHLTSCSFRRSCFTRKRYAASVRRQNRQKLRSCCALAERCGKKRRYLLDSQNRTPG